MKSNSGSFQATVEDGGKQEIKLSFEPSLCLWHPMNRLRGPVKTVIMTVFFKVHMAFNFLRYSHHCHIPEPVLQLAFSPICSHSWFGPAPVQLLSQLEAV